MLGMLDAGFSTLAYLKSRLLPAAAAGKTDWDDAVCRLGRSTAVHMQQHCSREFPRALGVSDIWSAAASAWVVTRFPIETVTGISLRGQRISDPTTALDAGSWNFDAKSGLVDMPYAPGTRTQKVIITWDGGYWLDPMDGTAIPDAATALPDDLLEAWVAQCQVFAEARGIFGAVTLRARKDGSGNQDGNTGDRLKLAESTLDILRPYRRYGGE